MLHERFISQPGDATTTKHGTGPVLLRLDDDDSYEDKALAQLSITARDGDVPGHEFHGYAAQSGPDLWTLYCDNGDILTVLDKPEEKSND
jgi:hypothetical protein